MLRFVSLFLAATIGLLALPAQAAVKVKCRCSVVKSDSKGCRTRAVVRDHGVIGTFKLFDRKKDAACKASCAAKLNAASVASACADVKTNLKVSFPWSGQVQACARVGLVGNKVAASRALSCAQTSGETPAPSGNWWKLTFADEFKGKPAGASAEVAACYDRAANCLAIYRGGPETCAASSSANLRHLNKCVWTVLIRNNWMMGDHEVNTFDPRMVRVEPSLDDGVLIIEARGARPDGSLYPEPRARKRLNGQRYARNEYLRKYPSGYDCVMVSDPWTGKPYRDKCPVVSGAVISQDQGANHPRGFIQKYGRFEVRAKIPYGPGSFPAYWMLPQQGSWPGAGEFDIIEAYTKGDYVNQGIVGGLCMPSGKPDVDHKACLAGGGVRWIQNASSGHVKPRRGPNRKPFWSAYHTFAIEWGPWGIRYLMDGVVTKTLKHLDLTVSKKMDAKAKFWDKIFRPLDFKRQLPWHSPDRPFFFLLNQTVKKDGDRKIPNPRGFLAQRHYIDYVRSYSACEKPTDFCPTGGTFEAVTGTCTGGRAPAPRRAVLPRAVPGRAVLRRGLPKRATLRPGRRVRPRGRSVFKRGRRTLSRFRTPIRRIPRSIPRPRRASTAGGQSYPSPCKRL